jgi:hypothetical protein
MIKVNVDSKKAEAEARFLEVVDVVEDRDF